jgi:hypothetical protein
MSGESAGHVRPSAAGTERDMREATDLAREVMFFGSAEAAEAFVNLAVRPIADSLPRDVFYVDYGGGQGVLAAAVRDFLVARGRRVRAMVMDANAGFLAGAAALGLETLAANIEQSTLSDVHLATMRLVNHYNDAAQQRAILSAIFRSLCPGGWLLNQIETGSAAVCRLHTSLANDLAVETALSAGYYWPTLNEYVAFTRGAGARGVEILTTGLRHRVSLDQALADGWRRFNGSAVRPATDGSAEANVGRRQRFFAMARQRVGEVLGTLPDEERREAAELADGYISLDFPILIARA